MVIWTRYFTILGACGKGNDSFIVTKKQKESQKVAGVL